MARAPWYVAAALGAGLGIVILLAGPLVLFNPAFTSLLQERHGVAEAFGVPQEEVSRVTSEILVDLFTDGDFDSRFFENVENPDVPLLPALRRPLLNEREQSHMHDVARVVRLLAISVVVAAIVAVLSAARMRGEPRRVGAVMMRTASVIGAAALALALTFAVAFEPAFLAFHAVFFPPGTFLFEPGSNLITLFPEGFWFDASLAAGATIVLSALIVALIGYRLWRGSPQTPLPA
jgi:integral membrane protein (TIGR01906 family)